MALKMYCLCGSATEYTLTKPLRCCMCGELFDKKSDSSTKPSQDNTKPFIQTPARVIGKSEPVWLEDEDGKYQEQLTVPKIDKLDVTIDLRGYNKKQTLAQLRPDLQEKMSNPKVVKKGRKSKK